MANTSHCQTHIAAALSAISVDAFFSLTSRTLQTLPPFLYLPVLLSRILVCLDFNAGDRQDSVCDLYVI